MSALKVFVFLEGSGITSSIIILLIPTYSTIARILSTILCMRLYKSVEDAVITVDAISSLSLKIAHPVAFVLASSANKYINAPPF
jgi:hypothetical protein